jgi:hypothetical protein
VAEADSQARLEARRRRSRPVADALHQWMRQQRQKIPDGSSTARAIDYSLNRWQALVRFIDDGDLPIDNNWVENRIRPIALGRQNWLFAGSLRAGKRAAAVMSLIHSAKLNGLDPYAYASGQIRRSHPVLTTTETDLDNGSVRCQSSFGKVPVSIVLPIAETPRSNA